MSRIKIQMDIPGCIELRNSPELQAECHRVIGYVKSMAEAYSLNPASTYGTDVKPGKTRAVARLSPTNPAAEKDNAANNTLAKALKNTKV